MPHPLSNRFLLACSLALLIFGCGDQNEESRPQFSRVVSFGDSLSDLGTYQPVAGFTGGGRFTTNPGKLWVEIVAQRLDLTLAPNRTEGFGLTPSIGSGTGYAQGGARVKLRPGTGCNPDPGTGECTFASAVPVAEQISRHLEASSLDAHDLVFVFAGSNDVFVQEGAVSASFSADQAAEAMRTAARDQIAEIQRVAAAGAKHIVTFTLPDSSLTPDGAAMSAEKRALRSRLVEAFNTTLKSAADDGSLGGALVVDAFASMADQIANPSRYGLLDVTHPACNLQVLSGGSSLFCSSSSLVSPNADMTYLFADGVHPSTKGHQNLANAVVARLIEAGWLE